MYFQHVHSSECAVFFALRLILARNGELLEIKPIADELRYKQSYSLSVYTEGQLERLIYHANGGPESFKRSWAVGCAEGVNLSVFSCVFVCARLDPPPLSPLSVSDRQTDQLLPLCCQSGPPSAVLHRKKIYNSCMQCQCLTETLPRHVEDSHMEFNFVPLNCKGTFIF